MKLTTQLYRTLIYVVQKVKTKFILEHIHDFCIQVTYNACQKYLIQGTPMVNLSSEQFAWILLSLTMLGKLKDLVCLYTR
jgi:hypothetical protein